MPRFDFWSRSLFARIVVRLNQLEFVISHVQNDAKTKLFVEERIYLDFNVTHRMCSPRLSSWLSLRKPEKHIRQFQVAVVQTLVSVGKANRLPADALFVIFLSQPRREARA